MDFSFDPTKIAFADTLCRYARQRLLPAYAPPLSSMHPVPARAPQGVHARHSRAMASPGTPCGALVPRN